MSYFRSHVNISPSCKLKLPYCCQYCPYIGYDKGGLGKHLQLQPSYEYFCKEKEVVTGLIPDFSTGKLVHNKLSPKISSYKFNRYSASGSLDNVQLNLTDDTISNIYSAKHCDVQSGTKASIRNTSSYMNHARSMACVNENTFPSHFDIASNNYNIVDEIEIGGDNDKISVNDFGETIEVTDKNHQLLKATDMRTQQDDLLKRFKQLTMNESDEISIDLFHLLKALNSPLIMFDRIIRWVKRHKGHLISNDSTDLMKRDKFIDLMNRKLYNDKILMKPKVCETKLSSGRNTNVFTFSFKEMIIRMVTNKSLFYPNNILLDPKNLCSDPPDSPFLGDVNTGICFAQAKRNECTLPNHIIMLFFHFIDGLSVDKCCLWFKRKARNRSFT